MHSRSALSLLLIALALLVAAPMVSAAGTSADRRPTGHAARDCGKAIRLAAFEIKTRKVSCRGAKRLIRSWNSKCRDRKSNRCRVRRFTCRKKFNGYDATNVHCRRGTRRVSWVT